MTNELHPQFMEYLLSDGYVTSEFVEDFYDEDMIKEIMSEQYEQRDTKLIVALKEKQLEYHFEFQEWLKEQGHVFNEDREDR